VPGVSGGAVEDPALWVFFVSGAIAICAMILPGISGSFLLLMLGMYDVVLGTVLGLALFSARSGCPSRWWSSEPSSSW